jgi:hypothetical protein
MYMYMYLYSVWATFYSCSVPIIVSCPHYALAYRSKTRGSKRVVPLLCAGFRDRRGSVAMGAVVAGGGGR